jgi:hypothetical protein
MELHTTPRRDCGVYLRPARAECYRLGVDINPCAKSSAFAGVHVRTHILVALSHQALQSLGSNVASSV